jgi:hypothetical protein
MIVVARLAMIGIEDRCGAANQHCAGHQAL